MNYTELQELKDKVKGGGVGSLSKYLEMLRTDSLERLTKCLPADLKRHQSRHETLSEIINLLG